MREDLNFIKFFNLTIKAHFTSPTNIGGGQKASVNTQYHVALNACGMYVIM